MIDNVQFCAVSTAVHGVRPLSHTASADARYVAALHNCKLSIASFRSAASRLPLAIAGLFMLQRPCGPGCSCKLCARQHRHGSPVHCRVCGNEASKQKQLLLLKMPQSWLAMARLGLWAVQRASHIQFKQHLQWHMMRAGLHRWGRSGPRALLLLIMLCTDQGIA